VTRGHRAFIAVGATAVLAVVIAGIVALSDHSTPLGVATLIAALAAALFALPEFIDRIRQPAVTVELLARTNPTGAFETIPGDEPGRELELRERGVEIEARIHNRGRAPLGWAVLNLQFLPEVGIRITDPPEKKHYENTHGGDSADLWPGKSTRCIFTVAEREFLPPHFFLYHVRVTLPDEFGEWPIVAVVEGGRPHRIHKDRIVLVRRDRAGD
jgi:hypothetical protein